MNTDLKDNNRVIDAFAQQQGGLPAAPGVREMTSVEARIVGAQNVAVYRDEARILTKLKTLASAAGQDWYYRYPVKNKKANTTDWIEGPSIKLANDLARTYGNCDVDLRVSDLGDSWLFYARFTDFETGFSLTRAFQQYKGASRLGGNDDSRRLDIAFQIGTSKAIRNVVVNALQTFADFAFEEAKNTLVEKIGKEIDRWRKGMPDKIKERGIDLKRVEAVVGRAAADWLASDIAKVIAMLKAITDGMATIDDTFPMVGPVPDRPQPDQFKKEGSAASTDGSVKAAAEDEKAAGASSTAPAADSKRQEAPVSGTDDEEARELADEERKVRLQRAEEDGQRHAEAGRSLRAMPGEYRADQELADRYTTGFHSVSRQLEGQSQ